MLSISLPPDLEKRLSELSNRSGRSVQDHLLQAIVSHVDEHDDADLAEARLRAMRSGESDTIPLKELLKRYGLDG